MPTIRLRHFADEIARARDLVGLGQSIGAMTHGRVDASDLYRAALVHAVAALDSYVHGVVLDRATDILLGRIASQAVGARIGLHFAAVQQILAATTSVDRELAARTHIAQRLSLETFQRPDDVANALSMVGVGRIWSTAFPGSPETAKTALGVIVQRRNRIVHQCDVDPLMPGAVVPLSDGDALASIASVETTVVAIDGCC